MLEHGEAKLLITDKEFSGTVASVLRLLQEDSVVDVEDVEYQGRRASRRARVRILLRIGDPDFAPALVRTTSGRRLRSTTLGTTASGGRRHTTARVPRRRWQHSDLGNAHHAVYLWTLPMFHCNGWTFPWSMAANVGTNVCLRRVDAEKIFSLIREHRVTHYCGAPIVHSTLINAPQALKQGITHQVYAMVAGAAPPAVMIEGMERMGFDITHTYGLTEVYGPATVCAKHDEWERLDISERARLNGRQGVRYLMEEGLTVMDPVTMQPVPPDGETMGEIMFRGNITMKGYLKNPRATREAFAGGWFHSGDLAVMHPDGYVKIKDRSKDIIVSGGENISRSQEVLYRHPAVLAAAVVAMPDEKWGETPCAFVETRPDQKVTEQDVIEFCRQHLAKFKAPRAVVFGELPKTSTGKIQKFVLREKAKSTKAIDT
jgi:fatty-acyl-CoA synthase